MVEIGALRGDTTVLLLDLLGPESELHVIDPLPDVRPRGAQPALSRPLRLPPGHQPQRAAGPARCRRGAGRRRPQLVHGLPRAALPARDCRGSGAARCRCSCCTTSCGPTAGGTSTTSRDRIPDEFRQPYARRGLLPGRRELCETGGLNPHLANALEEGGPRNGVLTALDDFVAEHDGSLRVVLLPLYFGLAIVADEQLLAARPQLGRGARPARERRGSLRADRARRVDPDRRAGGVPPRPSPRAQAGRPGCGVGATSTWSRAPCWTSTISRTSCASST